MRTAIMQPYFLPYAGYFQLIEAADRFVLCDDFQYTRHGWMTRNRFLRDGKDALFSLPIKSDSISKQIREREIAHAFNGTEILNGFRNAYCKSPFFNETMELVESIVHFPGRNLFDFLENSVARVCGHLGIKTPNGKTSDFPIDASLKKEERVIALCTAIGTDEYINSIGGRELYSKEQFESHRIRLSFLDSKPLIYDQFGKEFVSSLSIVDALMFNPTVTVRSYLQTQYALV
jgi:hypothetical protein